MSTGKFSEKGSFTERLQAALDVRQMTAAQLAKKTALSSGFISQVLSGKKTVRRSTKVFLAMTLQVNTEWLEHGRGEMAAPNVTETPKKPPATVDEKIDLLIRQMDRLILAFDTRREGSLFRGKHRGTRSGPETATGS